MKQDKTALFKSLEYPQPSESLHATILTLIQEKETKLARARLFSVCIIGLVSLIALIPAGQYVGNEMQTSGFLSYLSVLFSSSGAVLSSWKEFALALTESLPVIGIALFLTLVFIFLGSLKVATKNIYIARLSF